MGITFFTHYALRQVESGRFQSPEEAFRHCKRIGIDYGDLLGGLDEYPMHLHCKMLRDAGIEPATLIVCRNFASLTEKTRNSNLALVQEQIDTMDKLGIPMLMLAPGLEPIETEDQWKESKELLISGFAFLLEYAQKSGITVVMENQFRYDRPDAKMADVRDILDCVPGLGYVLDSGNFFGVDEDVVEAYQLLKDRTVHMHCKDWVEIPQGGFTSKAQRHFNGAQLGTALVPLRELADKMKQDGYKGHFCFEHNSAFSGQEFDDSIQFLRDTFL